MAAMLVASVGLAKFGCNQIVWWGGVESSGGSVACGTVEPCEGSTMGCVRKIGDVAGLQKRRWLKSRWC